MFWNTRGYRRPLKYRSLNLYTDSKLLVFWNTNILKLNCWPQKQCWSKVFLGFTRAQSKAYSELTQTSQMELSAVHYFCKNLHLRSLTGFWMGLCSKHPSVLLAVSRKCSIKSFLENFAKFTVKFKASDLQLYLKRDSGTGAFLWIFRDF